MKAAALPPFTEESAIAKVRMVEDAWNTRDPERVALAYSLGMRRRIASINDAPIDGSERRCATSAATDDPPWSRPR